MTGSPRRAGGAVSRLRPFAAFAAALCLLAPDAGEPADLLRLCADPDNLPFSSAESGDRGLYVELAELVAARMGVGAEYTWWRTYFGKRSVRNTLLADRCDAFFGLPGDTDFMDRSVALTRPFLEVGYAIIAPGSLAFSRLDDLKSRRVAVVFGSTPQLMLAVRGGFQAVTFRLPEEALDALGRREVDAAFVWGPTAGYYNLKKLGRTHRVVPVAGEGLQWKVAVGVRKGDDQLKERIERALRELQPEIRRLADRYGFPRAPAVDLESRVETTPAPRPGAAAVNPFRGDSTAVPAGRSTFNQHCSHCHAPNAMSPEPSRDLRRLKRRYGEAMAQVFLIAVTQGRPEKGMPSWNELLDSAAIWKVWTFLESVQLDP